MTDDMPAWTDEDLEALIGLPVRYQGREDWIVTGRSSLGQAAEITNDDDEVAFIGPFTVLAGEATFMDARPAKRESVLDWMANGSDPLHDTHMALRRLQLVNSQRG